jgi:DNA protecting protein DprA
MASTQKGNKQLMMFGQSPAAPKANPQPEPPAAEPSPEVPVIRPPREPYHCFESSVVALGLVKGIGHVTVKALVDAFDGDLSRVWKCDAERLGQILAKARTPSGATVAKAILESGDEIWEAGKQALDEMGRRNVHLLQRNLLPERLAAIADDPPRWLFIEGKPEVLKQGPFVAVVGTRRATADGIEATRRVCKVLARFPAITLVSGLAEGIDAEAHATSTAIGTRNIAFLGHGINYTFPASTAPERAAIIQKGGAVVTEYLPDEKFQKAYFVRRNRLQAALADLVIPVEADSKSGTAHTVNFAKAYGRKLIGMRWPGSNGIAEDLARDGYPVIDIFTDAGVQQLDAMFRDLTELAGGEVYAFAKTEEMFLKELKTRKVCPKDVARLIRTIESACGESREEWPLPASSSTIPSSSGSNPTLPPG